MRANCDGRKVLSPLSVASRGSAIAVVDSARGEISLGGRSGEKLKISAHLLSNGKRRGMRPFLPSS